MAPAHWLEDVALTETIPRGIVGNTIAVLKRRRPTRAVHPLEWH